MYINNMYTYFSITSKMSENFSYRFIASLTLLASIGRCIVYNISPTSSDTLCLNKSCMTLSQFVANSANISTELNLTIIFLPGNHTLNTSNFTIAEISNVSMKSLDGNDSVINCHKSSRFQFKLSTHVNINGLIFNGCFETQVHQVSHFIMEDCHLLGMDSQSGRGLLVTKSTLDIRRSYFISFHGSESQLQKGGAIYCSQSILYISDCTFIKNSALSGAALYIEGNSTAIVLNSSFFSHRVCNKNEVGKLRSAAFANVSSIVHPESNINNNSYCQGNLTINNSGGALSAFKSNISISECTFIGNTAFNGGAVYCHKGTWLVIFDTNFTLNKAIKYGGVFHQLDCEIHISRSNFSHNTGGLGGVLYHLAIHSEGKLMIEKSDFHNNSAERGGAAFFSNGIMNVNECLFSFNKATDHGGSLFLTFSDATIINSRFESNEAKKLGGALRAMNNSRVYILKSAAFENNSAFYGAAIHLYRAEELQLNGTITIINNKGNLGTIGVIHSRIDFLGDITFADNVGSLFAFGSNIFIKGTVNFTRHRVETQTTNISNTLEKKEGGCITLLLCKMRIQPSGLLSLKESFSINGGGILAISSNIDVLDSALNILGCDATDTGGGAYLYQSKLYIRGSVDISDNRAEKFGGGIHAISSMIVLHIQSMNRVHLYLRSNTASSGGSACLEVNSKFFITQLLIRFNQNGSHEAERPIHLFDNSAEFGGAIYVADNTNRGTCSSGLVNTITAFTQSECFFQIIAIGNDLYTFGDAFSFANNSANTSGSLLYGGLLDRCTVSAFSKSPVRYSGVPGYADDIINDTSSEPVKLYSCDEYGKAICDYESCSVMVTKGKKYTMKVFAVDQVNRMVNATVHIYLPSNSSGSLGEGRKTFTIGSTCSAVSFTVLSSRNYEEVVIYADGPCKNLGLSPLKVHVNFCPCDCPSGFEILEDITDRCVCVCHRKLLSLSFIKESDCNSTSLMIVRNKPFWISSTNETFIAYEDCPLNYCFPSTPPISITLNTSDGADAQCNFNRSGILCGRCKGDLTLSISSSRCIECQNYWPVIFVLVVVGTFLAGLVLVILLLLSNLTVAAGTLNGVIFYANIFGANRGLFMPFQHTNFHSVFIAWLNLDLGFDICFIKGMDTYVKAWLQFIFPIYLILVVVAVMIASKYSVKFSKVIARKNPVATLATLILLSYTKLLNSVISILSYATLSYIPLSEGDTYEDRRWLYDASMPYFARKHIPLFIVAIFILLLGIAYTFLLLFWQWLVLLPDRRIFRWLRNTKLSSFIDAYHAPFTARNRYWTGLLLLSRAILHLTVAINISGDPSINLLAVSLIVGCILLLQGYSGIRTYKKWILNILEFTSYFNILAFTLAKFYALLAEANHTTIASISIGIEFVLFLFIIGYHITVETDLLHKIRRSKWYQSHFHKDLRVPFLSNYQDKEIVSNRHKVTTTEIQLLDAGSNLASEQNTEPGEADDLIGRERDDIALLF